MPLGHGHPRAIGGRNTRDERDEEHCQERTEEEKDHQSRLHHCHVVPPYSPHRYAISVPKAFPRFYSSSIFDAARDSGRRRAPHPSFNRVIVATAARGTLSRISRRWSCGSVIAFP
jgi:hypothetical protein